MRTLALAQISVLALVSALLAAAASAQQSIAPPPAPAPAPQADANGLIWEVRPPVGDIERFRMSDYRMVVELRCRVANGSLVDCAPVIDTPQSFQESAIRSASAARLAPLDQSGQPTDGREIVVRITFPIPVAVDPPPAPPMPNVLAGLNWTEQPQAADFRRYYPERAFAEGVEGRATLDCLVDGNGRLSCVVTNEEPAGYGFGDAALRISRHFRVAPETADGRATAGGRIRRTIRFALG